MFVDVEGIHNMIVNFHYDRQLNAALTMTCRDLYLCNKSEKKTLNIDVVN